MVVKLGLFEKDLPEDRQKGPDTSQKVVERLQTHERRDAQQSFMESYYDGCVACDQEPALVPFYVRVCRECGRDALDIALAIIAGDMAYPPPSDAHKRLCSREGCDAPSYAIFMVGLGVDCRQGLRAA